jgi:hypothetical protein
MADVDKMEKQIAELMAFKAKVEPMLVQGMLPQWEAHSAREKAEEDADAKRLHDEIHKPLPPPETPRKDDDRAQYEGGQDLESDDSLRARTLQAVGGDDAAYDVKNPISNASGQDLDDLATSYGLQRAGGRPLDPSASGMVPITERPPLGRPRGTPRLQVGPQTGPNEAGLVNPHEAGRAPTLATNAPQHAGAPGAIPPQRVDQSGDQAASNPRDPGDPQPRQPDPNNPDPVVPGNEPR